MEHLTAYLLPMQLRTLAKKRRNITVDLATSSSRDVSVTSLIATLATGSRKLSVRDQLYK